MSNTNTRATVFFNKVSGQVWLARRDGSTSVLGHASNQGMAGALMSQRGIIRTGNWLIAYGPVRSCTVWV